MHICGGAAASRAWDCVRLVPASSVCNGVTACLNFILYPLILSPFDIGPFLQKEKGRNRRGRVKEPWEGRHAPMGVHAPVAKSKKAKRKKQMVKCNYLDAAQPCLRPAAVYM